MSKYLVDVNVIIALFDAKHEFHNNCMQWAKMNEFKLVISPIVENGLFRICTHPSYPNGPSNFQEIYTFLMDLRSIKNCKFIADSYSFTDQKSNLMNIPSRYITDVYLARLATKENLVFATFDRQIPHKYLENLKLERIHHLK